VNVEMLLPGDNVIVGNDKIRRFVEKAGAQSFVTTNLDDRTQRSLQWICIASRSPARRDREERGD
jgi:hypothetical protein